jgi:aspartate carbamoyltransferase catalytic subunit
LALSDAEKHQRYFMHPGPVNIGLEIDLSLLKSKYYLGHRQVESSIPVRMAILLSMLNNQDQNLNPKGKNAAVINYTTL